MSASLFDAYIDKLPWVSHLNNRMTPLTKAVISGVALSVFVKLVVKARRKRKYITDHARVGKRVAESTAVLDANALSYDFIVVGGGTSGCALASRLSENPNISVLLLESGGSGSAHSASRLPGAFIKLLQSPKLVHHFWTEPQEWVSGRKLFWPRAKMLGGCSSINAQMAQYGAGGDFDEWASIIGDDSWSWNNISRYFRKFEDFQSHPGYPNIDANVRGHGGPVQIGFNNFVTGWCDLFIRAGVNAGIRLSKDFNGKDGNTMGIGRVLAYINNNYQRVSSETAYLTPEVLERPNFTVVVNASVTRILFDTARDKPVAVGVEFAENHDGPVYHVRARKEVVICAGAVQSPTILMHSGLGPAGQLKEVGIPVIKDLPGVGSHVLEHASIGTFFKMKSKDAVKTASYLRPENFLDVLKVGRALMQYYVFGSGGPLSANFAESIAFVRTDDPILFPPTEYPEQLLDTTSSKHSPDLELFLLPLAFKDLGKTFFNVPSFSIHLYLLRPTSQGTITLRSSDPFDHPRIDPNYLNSREDLVKLVRGFRLALKLAHTEPIASKLDHSCDRADLDHFSHLKSDDAIEQIVRERVETVGHPTSSCRMARLEDGGVVDAQLRVYGVSGLRVCDASVFPSEISGHTAGACLAIAEKLADVIKRVIAGSS